MKELQLTHSFSDSPVSLAYVHEGESSTETGITLPLVQAELMFCLHGDFKLLPPTTSETTPKTTFFGLFTQPMLATVAGPFSMAGVFLHPQGFYQLTGQSVAAYKNQAVDAQLIWGKSIQQLYEKLRLATASERIGLLENFISQQPRYPLHPRVMVALDWLKQAEGGQDLVFRLAKTLKVSEKTVHADFKREIGLSPVIYQLLQRFQRSLGQLQTSDLNLSTLAHELDYYDQAHFIKRFSAFAQMTPGEYRKSMQEMTKNQNPHYLTQR